MIIDHLSEVRCIHNFGSPLIEVVGFHEIANNIFVTGEIAGTRCKDIGKRGVAGYSDKDAIRILHDFRVPI